MLQTLKRWFSGGSSQAGWDAVADWAETAGHGFKRTRDGEGFVVDARAPRHWRIEWGPRQRHYIAGAELRLRADLSGAPELQMLLISRQLMQDLEREVFEEFTDSVQTRIDTETPEEMRWLVMYPKLAGGDLHGLRERFGGVANAPEALAHWLAGPLAAQLDKAAATWLRPEEPLLLVVQRGRLTLRSAMAQPDVERLQALIRLFEVALAELRRVTEQWRGGPSAYPSTHPSLWERSALDPRADES